MILAPYKLYEHTGDPSILREYFGAMERWMQYLADHCEGRLVVREEEGGWCLGDWCFPDKEPPVPDVFVNSCYYANCAGLMSRIAAVLDLPERSAYYDALAAEIRKEIENRFYDPVARQYAGAPQGAAFALFAGLRDRGAMENAVAHYEKTGCFDTGILGTPLVLQMLVETGREDILLSLLRTEKEPSFAYLFDGGCTTLRECWDGKESHNHPMFGSVVGSLMRLLLGIPRSFAEPEQGLVVAPYIPRDMEWASGYTETPWGRLAVEWKRSACGALRIVVEAPDSIEGRLQYGGRSWPLTGAKTVVTIIE